MALARDTGVRCHIVHVSSARAARSIASGRGDADVSLETCPHYLLLDEEDLVRIGPFARCGPPLRPRATVDALWTEVRAGNVDMLASDHCPYTPEQKLRGRERIWDAGMGLTGIETSLPMFIDAAHHRHGMALTDIARMYATAPARRFGLFPRKGAISIGADADLFLYDPESTWTVSGAAFRGLGKWSAFEGMRCRGKVLRTLVRGRTVQAGGDSMVTPGSGEFVTSYAGPGGTPS
jgi:allantoinase